MKSSDITVVFQGQINSYIGSEKDSFANNLLITKKVLPNAQIILSTWDNVDVPQNLDLDLVVFNMDPGGLKGIKLDDNKANNINRQIVTTYNGIKHATTKYVLKLRTDIFLDHAGFLEFYANFSKIQHQKEGNSSIVVNSFFTIDPRVYEHMPFHVSDWVQFGEKETLEQYWDVPLMTPEIANFYETNSHKKNSGYFDKKFRTKFAVEQYIASNYAKKLGFVTPKYHNDCSAEVLKAHDQFLSKHFIVLDPWQFGINFPKYYWAYSSRFASMNCIMFLDWYARFVKAYNIPSPDPEFLRLAHNRHKSKLISGLSASLISPVGKYWYNARNRKLAAQLSKRFRDILDN